VRRREADVRIGLVGIGRSIVAATRDVAGPRESARSFADVHRPPPSKPAAHMPSAVAKDPAVPSPLPALSGTPSVEARVPATPVADARPETAAEARPETSFDARVAGVAARLHMREGDLRAVMRFESGMRPDAINPTSHAVGLIQFLPRTAADLLGLPMTPDREARAVRAFAAMSADEQLDYVEIYLQRVLGSHGAANLRDAYMAVLYPAAVGKGDGYVLGSADSESAFGRAVYRQNAGLDVNGDGVITAGEAARQVGGVKG
jgi:hypothetical protein